MSRVHGLVDRYSGRSTVDSRPGQGGALTDAWRVATTEGGSSPRKHLGKEGTEGTSPRRWWAPGRRGLAGRRWTEVAAEVSRWGSIWSTKNGSWGRDWMRWRDGVLLGALYRAAAERSRWRPVEFNGAAVLSLESAPKGRGNGGAAPLRKGKWRRCGLGRRGGARRDSSRLDGQW